MSENGDANPTFLGSASRSFGSALRRYWWVVAVAVVATASLGLTLSELRSPQYEGTAQVVVKSQNLFGELTGGGGFQDSNRVVATQADLVRVPSVVDSVIEELGLPTSEHDRVSDNTAVQTQVDSDILTIRSRWEDRGLAVRMANSFATEFVDYRAGLETGALVAAERDIARQIAELRRTNPGSQYLQQLERTRLDLRTRILVGSRNTEVVRRADEATQVEPQPVQAAVLSGFAGLVLGLGVIALVQLTDRRVRTAEEVASILGSPLLAAVASPRRRGRAREEGVAMLSAPASHQAEAYRVLAANLRLTNVGGRHRTVLIASCLPGEGKTTSAANLAVAAARAGTTTVVVDGDLRKPRLARALGARPRPGLTSVLTAAVDLERALQELPIQDSRDGVASRGPSGLRERTLALLASGPTPPNPGDFVTSGEIGDVISELRERFSLTVIDSPPWLAAGDALALAPQVDGIVMIVRSRSTERASLRAVRRDLERIETPVLGFVLTNWKAGRGESYSAGYAEAAASPESAPDRPAAEQRPQWPRPQEDGAP